MTDIPRRVPARRVPAIALAAMLAVAGCASTTDPAAPPPAPVKAGATAPEDAQRPTQTRERTRVVKPSHPVRYTVRPDDTLWDIADKFLHKPWLWPEFWQANPQIENPHLIYPGDVITLTWIGGEPRLRVSRPASGTVARPASGTGDLAGREVERLEPHVREKPLAQAIPSIPAGAIRPFLIRPRIIPREQIENAPYILGNYEGRLISAPGDAIFARGFSDGTPNASRYSVFRPGEPLRDSESDEVLGYQVIHIGKAVVRDPGPPARLRIVDATRAILSGDRLLPEVAPPARARYIPQVPDQAVEGEIIALFDAISQVATNQVVVVDLGATAGMEIGHVLGIWQSGGVVEDPHASNADDLVQLPPQRVGTMMLFRVFDRVSYALILDATHPVRLHDHVTPP